jgi:hypothetical protein
MTSFAKHIAVLGAALIATTALAEKSADDKSSKADAKETADKKGKKGKGSKSGNDPDAPKKIDVPVQPGHPSKGLVIPYYDSAGKHEMQFRIGVASRIDENHIAMTDLGIETFDENGKHEMQIDLPAAVLDTNSSVITSKKHVTVRREDFELTGEAMIFNTRTKQGGLGGNVRMLIYNLDEETSDTAKPAESKDAVSTPESKEKATTPETKAK